MAKQPDWHIFSIKVRDRFGDHGLVGVAIAHDQGEQCEVDTFLLSCRVIGRTVETALLAHLAKALATRLQAPGGLVFADEEKCTGARFLRAAWFRAAEDGWHGLFVGIRSGEFYSAQPRLIKLKVTTENQTRRNELTASTLEQVRNVASDILGIPRTRYRGIFAGNDRELDSMQHLNLVLAIEESSEYSSSRRH